MTRAREPQPRPVEIPIGPRLERVLEVAFRARRPVLLEGPTGIGKSELVQSLAQRLAIATVVLDLSLLEPPDLVGLPHVENGRTAYALPRFLPRDGEGILMLEELNRAERYIQQPALQLLTARRLHEYELPPGWACFAAVNPDRGEYQVTPLDPALRARFLTLQVRADRAAWLSWAAQAAQHPAVLALARAHDRFFDEVPPRTWTYVSQVLTALTPAERSDTTLMRDLLSGYLSPTWVELLLAERAGWEVALEVDVHKLLCDYKPGGPLQEVIRRHRDRGETDRIGEIARRLGAILRSPEAGVLLARSQLKLDSFEALLADLPGDHREELQEALGTNATVAALIDVKPEEVLKGYAGSAAHRRVGAWSQDPLRQHRIGLLVTALRSHLQHRADLPDIKRTNAARTNLGHFLLQVGPLWATPLVETLQRLGVTPIRPSGAGGSVSQGGDALEAWLRGFVTEKVFLERYPYYAGVLARMVPVADPSIAVMGVSLHGAGYFLHVNIDYFQQHPDLLRGVLMHEVHHVVLGHLSHPKFHGATNPDLMEIAKEISANEHIEEPLPPAITWKDFERFGVRPGQSTMDRYEKLVQARMAEKLVMPRDVRFVDEKTDGDPDPHALARTRGLVADAVRTVKRPEPPPQGAPPARKPRLAGRDPDFILEDLEDTRAPPAAPIDWQTALALFTSHARAPAHTYGRPNRRFPARVGEIPGRVYGAREIDKPRLLVAIDTSASMSKRELSEIARHLRVLESHARFTVAECDVEVQRVYPFEGALDDVKGRGGTDLRPVFEQDLLREVRADGVVYFTDGDGPYPPDAPGLPTLWVLTESHAFTCPWGQRATFRAER